MRKSLGLESIRPGRASMALGNWIDWASDRPGFPCRTRLCPPSDRSDSRSECISCGCWVLICCRAPREPLRALAFVGFCIVPIPNLSGARMERAASTQQSHYPPTPYCHGQQSLSSEEDYAICPAAQLGKPGTRKRIQESAGNRRHRCSYGIGGCGGPQQPVQYLPRLRFPA